MNLYGGQGFIEIKTDDNGIQYACKHLLAGKTADSDSVYRFKREIQIIEKISSPNVIKIIGYGEDEKGCFYNMPVYRISLLQFIQNNDGTLFQNPILQKKIFMSILSGVDALHRSGIIHRDLKPGNILMNSVDDIVVCDFGFSKDLDSTSSYTGTGDVFGTPRYISPEQEVDSKHVDKRTDIYALGQILNDLSGRRLGMAPIQIQLIANKASEYNPDDRYGSVTELKNEVTSGYDVWLRSASGITTQKIIKDILSQKVDSISLLGYVDMIVNNRYYQIGDAEELSVALTEKQYMFLESTNEDLCMKMFEHIWNDFSDTWNNVFSRIDDMTSIVSYYWDISKSYNVKGYLLGELTNIAREGNRFSAMVKMTDLISEIADDPLVQKVLLRNTSVYTIKENYKIIGKIPPTWL